MSSPRFWVTVIGVCLFAAAGSAYAQTTAFTYQGQLTNDGQPARGPHDFVFRLFDAESGGASVAPDILRENIPVENGVFTTTLDFGFNAFFGTTRWLEIMVRPAKPGANYVLLWPRQPILSTPQSNYALTTDDVGASTILVDPTTGLISIYDPYIEITDVNGEPRAVMVVAESGEATLSLFGPGQNLNVDLSASLDDPRRGFVGVGDQLGQIQASMGVLETGEGGFSAWGPNGNLNLSLSSLEGDPNRGYIAVADDRGMTQAALYTLSSGEGGVSLWGPNDNLNVDISASLEDPNDGFVGVADQDGFIQGALGIFSDGAGGLSLWGPNGELNVDISSDDPNHGFVGVGDEDGEIRAGIYIDDDGDGIVFGDHKEFVIDHPKQAGSEIVYASLEGAEVGIYSRGTVQLQNGRAFIELPEHFTALANPESISVQLTPASFESAGVGYQLGKDGRIEVRELNGGTGEYRVSYWVQAIRAGDEDFQPVRAKEKRRTGLDRRRVPELKTLRQPQTLERRVPAKPVAPGSVAPTAARAAARAKSASIKTQSVDTQ